MVGTSVATHSSTVLVGIYSILNDFFVLFCVDKLDGARSGQIRMGRASLYYKIWKLCPLSTFGWCVFDGMSAMKIQFVKFKPTFRSSVVKTNHLKKKVTHTYVFKYFPVVDYCTYDNLLKTILSYPKSQRKLTADV